VRGQPQRWTPRVEQQGPVQGDVSPASISRGIFSWPKAAKLRKRPEFLRVQEAGRRRSGRHVTVVSLRVDGGASCARFGLVVTRKLGGAVVRNRIKRRLREILRQVRGMVAPADVVLLARRSVADARWDELVADVGRALGVDGVKG
jgi:ribonuclease P protein component